MSPRPSLPQPTTLLSLPTVHPRPLKPILPPSSSPGPQSPLPAVPSPPRQPIPPLAASYTLSTHILPAARPRSAPHVPVPADLSPEAGERIADKAEKRRWVGRVVEWLLEVRKRYAAGEVLGEDESGEGLWNVVNRYALKDGEKRGEGGKGATLFFAHATGFPKEIWEPTIAHLVAESSASSITIDEIWAWEAVQHGDAALLNESLLNHNSLCDWRDNTRDMVNFLTYYLPPPFHPESPSNYNYPPEPYKIKGELPTHLAPVPASLAQQRLTRGFEPEGRTLIVAGHSFGGCTATLAALTHPSLFTGGLVLIDPVILPVGTYNQAIKLQLTAGAVGRRAAWKSREEAHAQFAATPFFAAWDPAVLRVYVECGLADHPEGGVRLKMSGFQEAAMFSDTTVAFEVFERLPALDERVELKWVLPGKPKKGDIGGEEMQPYRAWRRPANAGNVLIPGAGHLITQEAPKALAEEIWEFVQKKCAERERRGVGRARL
ncbi:hypothetical protein GLOTRDRAFT_80888 [Gloeophyllum trabeum ATCC 11539]|uniref:AB hydrolase-1 domain-containing protein n=1 Tax=Gloeophyllum trabeum (strain ATCC 11539 / FP-39264 / Madison 617) TaxID=670483 RepID=S7PW81_GLOTA|nr:uncharacterized protein GLOTRDRAFT_80888 [Gloeophyllum trabeum ATCC 11539]EPQ51881.1 hypothetical protein GLOTRDRAFT_80888 [Gloeophyllum trabeum ATCC 11539]